MHPGNKLTVFSSLNMILVTFAIVISTFTNVASGDSVSTKVNGYGCHLNEYGEWEDCSHIHVGYIIGMVCGAIALFIGGGFLICFLCACCCFKGRRTRGEVYSQTIFVQNMEAQQGPAYGQKVPYPVNQGPPLQPPPSQNPQYGRTTGQSS